MLSQNVKNILSPKKYPNNLSKTGNILKIWNRSFHLNDCFLFLDFFSIIYQAHFIRSSV